MAHELTASDVVAYDRRGGKPWWYDRDSQFAAPFDGPLTVREAAEHCRDRFLWEVEMLQAAALTDEADKLVDRFYAKGMLIDRDVGKLVRGIIRARDKRAAVRKDTGDLFNFLGTQFTPLQNEDAVNFY